MIPMAVAISPVFLALLGGSGAHFCRAALDQGDRGCHFLRRTGNINHC